MKPLTIIVTVLGILALLSTVFCIQYENRRLQRELSLMRGAYTKCVLRSEFRELEWADSLFRARPLSARAKEIDEMTAEEYRRFSDELDRTGR